VAAACRGDLDQREVGLRIAADDLRVALGAVLEDGNDLVGVLDHVVVRDDQTVGRHHEARAGRRHAHLVLLRLLRRLLAGLALLAEELLEELFGSAPRSACARP
jgi:hypothetical protein